MKVGDKVIVNVPGSFDLKNKPGKIKLLNPPYCVTVAINGKLHLVKSEHVKLNQETLL